MPKVGETKFDDAMICSGVSADETMRTVIMIS